MDFMHQLELKRSTQIKGLFDPFAVNKCPNIEYLRNPFGIFKMEEIQEILRKRNARIEIQVINCAISEQILMINDALEGIRQTQNHNLITSFYTIQEYSPWAHATNHLVSGNLMIISSNAQYLPDSWFPPAFIKVLGQLLNFYSRESRIKECLAIYKILYYAIKKNIKLNLKIIIDSINAAFIKIRAEYTPVNLFILLIGLQSISFSKVIIYRFFSRKPR